MTLKETTATLWGPSNAKAKLSCFPALSILLLEKISFICETLQATWIMPPFPTVAPVKSIRVFNGKQSIFNYHFLEWRGLEWKTLITFGKFHRCNLAWGCTVDENISCSPRWHETSKEISDNYLYREDINLKLMHTHLINLVGQCSTWWENSMFEFNYCDINPVLDIHGYLSATWKTTWRWEDGEALYNVRKNKQLSQVALFFHCGHAEK